LKALYLAAALILVSCVTAPPVTLSSWDGKNGKVRQGLFGPRFESKIEPEMEKIMIAQCPTGYNITKIGSDIHPGIYGSAEAKTKEFTCK
jgi:hypothetical protein